MTDKFTTKGFVDYCIKNIREKKHGVYAKHHGIQPQESSSKDRIRGGRGGEWKQSSKKGLQNWNMGFKMNLI